MARFAWHLGKHGEALGKHNFQHISVKVQKFAEKHSLSEPPAQPHLLALEEVFKGAGFRRGPFASDLPGDIERRLSPMAPPGMSECKLRNP